MRVSVVIPVYNGGEALAECLRALAAQTLPAEDYQVIVVDDGSTDGSAEAAKRFGARLLRQTNQGAASARNRGLRESRAEWVAFTDADCVPSREWLGRLLAAVMADGRRDGALGAGGAHGRFSRRLRRRPVRRSHRRARRRAPSRPSPVSVCPLWKPHVPEKRAIGRRRLRSAIRRL